MAFADYGRYDALGLAELVRTGQVSAAELLDEALARTAQVNPKINAVIHLMESRAREEIAAGLPAGPLRGVPFLVKDLLAAAPANRCAVARGSSRTSCPARTRRSRVVTVPRAS